MENPLFKWKAFVSFLKTYYLKMNEYWIVIYFSQLIKKRMILLFVMQKAFIFGRNQFFGQNITDFWKYAIFLQHAI